MTIQRQAGARLGRLLGVAVALALLAPLPAVAQEPSLGVSPSPTATLDPTLEDRLEAAEAEIRELTVERDRLRDAIAGYGALYDPMEADRQLLVELRKELPETRVDAESYLARMHRLAALSDPARLSQLADRVLETAPVFLDWRDTEFATPQEASQAFLESGAAGFDTDFEEFKDAILLTVANRLDALLTMQDRVR
jgi:hypothetical protein